MCIRRMPPVIMLVALSGCTTQIPGMPTKADFQRAQENPVITQPSLGGRVTSAVTGEPILNAVVTVQGRAVASSPTGHYGFDPNLTAGVSLVKVTHPAYVDREREVEVKPFAMADFALQPK